MLLTLWLQRGCGYGLTERKLCSRWEDKAQKHLRCLLNTFFFLFLFFFKLTVFFLVFLSFFDGVHSTDFPCPGRWTFLAQPWITVCSWRNCWSRNPSRRGGLRPPTLKCASLSWPNPCWLTTNIAMGYVEHFLSQSNGRKDEICLREGRMLMEGRMIFVKFF